jgi:putative SOS response-associated peptidase YedK
MIERYSLTATADQLEDRFAADVIHPYEPCYNAAPTKLLPIITHTAPKGISVFYWGTSPEWAKNKTLSEKIINIRAESIIEKPALKRTLMKARCIIPADGFYAWKKVGKKTFIPYRFVTHDKALISFAGLWEEYEDTDGNEFHTFSIITTQANTMVSPVHDRMPVILNKQTEKVWLDPQCGENDLMKVLTPYDAGKMNLYSVSPRISDIESNVPSLITPAPPADQFGNLTLFD